MKIKIQVHWVVGKDNDALFPVSEFCPPKVPSPASSAENSAFTCPLAPRPGIAPEGNNGLSGFRPGH